MRVLMMHDYLVPLGGAEKFFFMTKKLLEDNGHTVEVMGSDRRDNISSFFSRWFNIGRYLEAKKIISEFKPDVVYSFSIYKALSPSPLIAAKQANIPVVVQAVDPHIVCPVSWAVRDGSELCQGFSLRCISGCPNFKKGGYFRFAYKILKFLKIGLHRLIVKRCADRFICPSKQIKQLFAKSLKLPEDKFIYLPHFIKNDNTAVDFDKMDPKQFLFVGRLCREKGADLAIRAIHQLKIEGMEDVRLKIIGEGPERSNLTKLTKDLGLENNVEFLGWIEGGLDKYYQESLAVLIPSIWLEVFGIVSLEAMKNAKPIIAPNYGAFPDYTEHGKNGFLFKRNDFADMVKYMKMICDNKQMSMEMGQHGQRLIKELYTEKKYYDDLMKVLDTRNHL